MIAAGDVQHAWAVALIRALGASGVTQFVLSPGSRSTPLALALLAEGIAPHVVIDERAAAFFALGLTRRTSQPVALVCTSGSAGAHYLPAIIEAWEGGGMLIAVTADRPPELQQCGAAQTTDQSALFGRHVAVFAELGPPSASHRGLAGRVARAVAHACAQCAPVHLNAPLRKPLEPETWPPQSAETADPPRVFSAVPRAMDAALDAAAALLDRARSGVVLAGAAPLGSDWGPAIRSLCAATGFPLYTEPTSQLRDGISWTESGGGITRCDALSSVLGAGVDVRPDVVVQVGGTPIATAVQRWLSACGAPHLVLSPDRWPDGALSASLIVHGTPVDALARLTARVTPGAHADARTAFAEGLRWLDDASWAAAREGLAGLGDVPTEATALITALAAIPPEGVLFLGNSRSIRDADTFVPALPRCVGIASQRGVAGIDGNIAHIAGLAVGGHSPVTGVIGDVTFAHDAGALALLREARVPLALVVIDNGGGRIFDDLPIAGLQLGKAFQELWLTPTTLDVGAIARAFGLALACPATLEETAAAVRSAHGRAGATVIWVRILSSHVGRGHEIVASARSRALQQGLR